jgi:hypothetical protein
LTPHASPAGLKLNVRNGSSISIVQPISLRRTRASQMPSQSRLAWPEGFISESAISPDGFISKK